MKWFQKPQDDAASTRQLYAATILAAVDLLSALRNRSAIPGTLLERECYRAQELGHPLTLLRLELANWADSLQTIGAERGEQTQAELELVLQGTLRTTDILQNEPTGSFIILLPGTTALDVPTVTRNLRQAVRGYRILVPDNVSSYLRLHPWIASASLPEDGLTAHRLTETLEGRLTAQRLLPPPAPDDELPPSPPPLRLVA